MRVSCEKCHSEYEIDEGRVPAEGLQVKCPRCSTTFIVTRGGKLPETAGDLFDIGAVDLPRRGDSQDSLELDLTPQPSAPAPPPAAGPARGGSTLPPIGPHSSSLPPLPGRSPAPEQVPGSEGQIFDFLDRDIGEEPKKEAGLDRFRIRRKSGKVFGPFDAETVNKMLAEHQLMGNEEASVDGHNYKPLGAFAEFADTIRLLMEEPLSRAKPIPPSVVEGFDTGEVVASDVAPRGVEFAEPLAPAGRKHPGPLKFLLLGLASLLVLLGLGLGFFTRHGFFGYKLMLKGSGESAMSGDDEARPQQPPSPAREHFDKDTFAGYSKLIDLLEPKLKNNTAAHDELYLLGLSYAAMLRNYGANEVYLARGRQIVSKLKEEAADRPETRRVEAALLVLTDAARAGELLDPLVGKDCQDKEALFLSGWAMAYQKNWIEAARRFDRAVVLDPDYSKAFHALGDIQSLQGDFDNALLFYEKALEKNPDRGQSALEQARIHIEAREDDKVGQAVLAGVFGDKFKTMSPSEQAMAHSLRAKIHLRRRDKEKAVVDLDAAIKLMPTRLEYQAALGNFLLDSGEYSRALSTFDKVLSLDANNVDAMVGKGRAMWQNGDIVKAKMLLEQTAATDKNDPRPIYLLGRISEDLDKPVEALDFYRAATKMAPSYITARVAVARLLLKQGQLKEALGELAEASKVNPKSAEVRCGLGEVYLKQGNLRLARGEFETALQLDPELAAAHFYLAQVLREQGKLDEALLSYKRVEQISPRYPDLALEYGYTLFLQKDHDQALKMYEEAVRQNPKDHRLYVRAGLAADALGEAQTAAKYFQSALGIEPKNGEALFNLGLMMQRQNEHDQALDLFKRVVELDRNNAEARYRMGVSYMATDATTDAIDELREAVRLNPRHLDALLELGRVLAQRLEFAEAITHLQRVAREQPRRVDVLLLLGDVYIQQGLQKKALKTYQAAYARNPRYPGLAYRIGRTFQDLDKRKQAVSFLLKAIALDRNDPMPHLTLGYIYKAYGNNHKAHAEFRRYLQLLPDAPDAEEIREEMEYLRR